MDSKILDREAFCQMMETSFDNWFHREGVEQHCQAEGIYFDIGHYWDCVWLHRQNGSIEQRPSGIVHEFSLWQSPHYSTQVQCDMPEFKFLRR